MDRIIKVNERSILAAGGEISDFQYIQVRRDRLPSLQHRTHTRTPRSTALQGAGVQRRQPVSSAAAKEYKGGGLAVG